VAKRFTPGRLLGHAQATRETFGTSVPKAVCSILLEVAARRAPRAKHTPPEVEPAMEAAD
jgi:hypothetical protein